jgi:hypothetical protein
MLSLGAIITQAIPPLGRDEFLWRLSRQGIASGGPRVPPRADSAQIFKPKL